MSSRWIYAIFLGLTAAFISVSQNYDAESPTASVSVQTVTEAIAQAPVPTLKFGEPLPGNAFIELAKAVNPAVVNINTSTTVRPRRGGHRDPFFDMLEQFYGMRQMQPMPRKSTSLGTGFIIKEDGLIITNNHVIAGADVINVQLNDNSTKQYEAKVIGSDERTDIALIKITGKGFPTAKLGSSSDTQVGEWVAAFGNPFGNGHTMTKGIISAKGRDISEINRFPLLQTDAPINPGNSGGPLVNMRGEVIGVNSAIDARAQGIGFAIPIDEVKSILPQLEKSMTLKRGYMGVVLGELSPQHMHALGIPVDTEGAVIAQVEPKGPADAAGIQPYDIVTEFNGKKIRSSADLLYAVGDTTVGAQAKVKLLREGKEQTVELKVAERDDARLRKVVDTGRRHFGEKAPFKLGFNVSDVNADLIKEFSLPRDAKRPIIVQVDNDSVASRAGLLPGDMILDVNRRDVTKTDQAFKQLKKGTNTLRIYREGTVVFVILRVE